MAFTELTLVYLGYFGIHSCGRIVIDTDSIVYAKECDEYYLIKTKLDWDCFRITKEEYSDKISHLFKKGTIELSFGRMFVKDIEAFWNIDDRYFMQTRWSDVKIEITKKDYTQL